MIRGYLILAVLLGLLASLAGSFSSSPQSAVPSDRPTQFVPNGLPQVGEAETLAASTTGLGDGSVRLQRDANGHFYADVLINGATINALVDTGASTIALSRDDARKAGLATSIGMPNVIGQGADGEVHGEVVTLDSVSLGGTTARDLRAMVLNSGQQTLLGQDFLSRFERVEISGDTMVLR